MTEFDLFDVDELTAVHQLEDRLRELWHDLDEQLDEHIRYEIAQTDWEYIEVLDVLVETYTSDTLSPADLSDMDVAYSVRGHGFVSRDRAPDPEQYTPVTGDTAQLFRITEQRCRTVGIDPESGEVLDDD